MLILCAYLSIVFSTFVAIFNLIDQSSLLIVLSAFLISFLFAILQSSYLLSQFLQLLAFAGA